MNPYTKLSEHFFWSTAVAQKNMLDIDGLWNPKFNIRKQQKVVTFGSCFAQHIGKALRSSGYNWLNTEPSPKGLSSANAKKFNYDVFSSRTGNIYTVSLLRQWVRWAIGRSKPPTEIWEKNGRFYDPFRPNIEPEGFLSAEEVIRSRQLAIEAFKKCLMKAEIFVFTLGLTESWFNKKAGYEYPMCPGTLAGEFNEKMHEFVNQDYAFIQKTLIETIKMVRRKNPKIKFLLTVSPVPLTATMSGNHVLVATMESKSVLRAVAGQLRRDFDYVDYFPSYEIINGAPFKGAFFELNQRQVTHTGVDHVMSSFFRCLNNKFPKEIVSGAGAERRGRTNIEGEYAAMSRKARRERRVARRGVASGKRDDDLVCEEELLNAFK